ncbi:MAG: hypothetical protein GWO08_06615, partial [Gammaproteobacteria bacterium]|nr:hypothetical protein [Gammaproteobacteria bacterium]NIR93346.1 hypothetical protein [Gammaproteobacteria bacterium]NIW43606.1 hypothetical protein [Gammaproteobacteria bacterium]NIW98142.1 hypothetical protein [Phycisphaerae bacterium]
LTDKDLGTMTVGDYTDVFFSIHNPYRYFGNSRWGYYFEYGFSNFSMRLQEITQGIEYLDVNYGTGVNGWYMYLTPVLFYHWKPQGWFGTGTGNGNNDGLLFGIGIGGGYLDAKGTIRLTELNP